MNNAELRAEIERLFAVVRQKLNEVEWVADELRENELKGKAYCGAHHDFRLCVVSFSLEEQGFPRDTFGYDGALSIDGTVVRLTREFAKKLFTIAEEQSGPGARRSLWRHARSKPS
jgi:hypothetical protein